MNKGKLIVISGPSGVGKGTICNRIMEVRDMDFSVSMTTRKPRDGEIHGVHYYFVTHARFEEEIQRGGLLEFARAYDNYYGTPREAVIKDLEAGRDILLDIEMQGALQVKRAYPEAVLIFVLPPSIEDLRNRLSGRGSETKQTLNLRLGQAIEELEYLRQYDYYIVNDDLDRAVKDCLCIIDSEHNSNAGAEGYRVLNNAEELLRRYREEK